MVEDNDPRAFFESSWFKEICHLVGLNHDAVRATVADRVRGNEPLTRNVEATGTMLAG